MFTWLILSLFPVRFGLAAAPPIEQVCYPISQLAVDFPAPKCSAKKPSDYFRICFSGLESESPLQAGIASGKYRIAFKGRRRSLILAYDRRSTELWTGHADIEFNSTQGQIGNLQVKTTEGGPGDAQIEYSGQTYCLQAQDSDDLKKKLKH